MSDTPLPFDAPPATRSSAPAAASPRAAAVVAAISTFVMAGAGMFASLSIASLLGDGPDGVGARVADGHVLLRLAIVAFLLVAVLDVVLAWAIMRYFGDRHHGLPTLAGWLRVAYAAVLATATGRLAVALQAATGSGTSDDRMIHASLLDFSTTWQLGLVVFAAHLAVLGTILVRDTCTPTLLGAVIVVAGIVYASNSVAELFLTEGALLLTVLTGLLATASIIGEVGLGIWFLVRGGRVR